MKHSIFFALLILTSFFCNSQIVINEVCSKNNNIILDFEDDASDWIEIKNISADTINLATYYLSDDFDEVIKWQFPSFNLLPDSIFFLFASDKNINTNSEYHCNFKISSSYEELYIFEFSGTIIDSITVPALLADNSYGIHNNSISYFETPTPKQSNENSIAYFGYVETPVLNHNSGIYTQNLNLEVVNFDSSVTYTFTNNGDYPLLNSSVFNNNLLISNTKVLSLRAFKTGYIQSKVVSKSYFINEDSSYPIVSLIFPPKDFFGDEGIYVYGDSLTGNNIYQDIRTKVYIDYFNEANEVKLQNYYEAKLHGGSSRSSLVKSLAITAKKSIGASEIENEFYDEGPESYKSIILRNSGNDFHKCYMRDAVFQTYLINNGITNVDLQKDKLSLVYFNGAFWGIQHIREKYSEHLYASIANVEVDEINYMEKNGVLAEGSDSTWLVLLQHVNNLDLNVDSNYRKVDELLDVKSFVDEFVIQSFVNNTDWPQNNIKFWNVNNDSSKWRYSILDTDIGYSNWYNSNADDDRLGAVLFDEFTTVFENEHMDSVDHVQIYKSLLNNSSFKNLFINRYCDLLNTIFIAESINAAVDVYNDSISIEMPNHMAKWSAPSALYWEFNLNKIKTFFIERNGFARKYVQENLFLEDSIYITLNNNLNVVLPYHLNTIYLNEINWTGQYFKNIPIDIALLDTLNLDFLYWKINFENGDSTTINNLSFNYNFDQSAIITAIFEDPLNFVDDVMILERFVVYPNPVENHLFSDLFLSHDLDFEIYNLNGAKMNVKQSDFGYFDVSNLPSGIFFVKLLYDNKVYCRKFVK